MAHFQTSFSFWNEQGKIWDPDLCCLDIVQSFLLGFYLILSLFFGVTVRKLKILAKPHPLRSSSLSAVDTNTAALSFEGRTPSHKRSLLSTGWSAVRKMRFVPKQGTRSHNSSQRSMAYVNAGAEYVRHVSGMLKEKVSSLRHSSLAELPQGINASSFHPN